MAAVHILDIWRDGFSPHQYTIEDRIFIIKTLRDRGRTWKHIGSFMGGVTGTTIKNHYDKYYVKGHSPKRKLSYELDHVWDKLFGN